MAEINDFEQCEWWWVVRKPSDEWSGVPDSTSLHSLTPQPQLRLPLHPQPQPHLHPLHPSGSSSEGGGGCKANSKIFIIGGAVAHFGHINFFFLGVGGGSMDVRYTYIYIYIYVWFWTTLCTTLVGMGGIIYVSYTLDPIPHSREHIHSRTHTHTHTHTRTHAHTHFRPYSSRPSLLCAEAKRWSMAGPAGPPGFDPHAPPPPLINLNVPLVPFLELAAEDTK